MYNLQHLKYAVEVARTGSISRAAENLYIGQPRLSRAIRELEDSSGIILFNRTPRGVVPTQKGAEFLEIARMILGQLEELEALYSPSTPRQQCFDLCAPRASYVSSAFAAFSKAADPALPLRFSYHETNAAQSIRNVADGTNNLAVIRAQTIYERFVLTALEEKDLRSRTVSEFEMRVLMSSSHPLAVRGTVTQEDLAPYTELVHGDSSVPSLPASEARHLAHGSAGQRTISVYERGSQFDLLSSLSDAYMWCSPVPSETLERFSLVECRGSKPNNLYRDYLIYRRGYRFTQTDSLFCDKLSDTIRSLGMEP